MTRRRTALKSKSKSRGCIFISWTKPQGRELARHIRRFLKPYLPGERFFVSADDIQPGSDWRQAVDHHLQHDRHGILIVTRASLESPWVLFEAGALSARHKGGVIPLLFEVGNAEVAQPLGAFQGAPFSAEGMWALVRRLLELRQEPARGAKAADEGRAMPRGFKTKWERLDREVSRLLKKEIHIDPNLRGSGDYAFYALKLGQPGTTPGGPTVHRAHLKLGADMTGARRAMFKTIFDEYRGTWTAKDGQVSAELENVKDESDRFFLLLKRRKDWMWGVFCGLATDMASVAGRCYLRRLQTGSPKAGIRPRFIDAASCRRETHHPQLAMDVIDYLAKPVDSVLTCRHPLE